MSELHTNPGSAPAAVEPEPVEATMVVSALHGHQIGVTANWRHLGLVGLTVRIRGNELTVALADFEVDALCRLLAAACPIEALPGYPDTAPAAPVDLLHRVLASHQVDVACFRRRNGYAWWCSCLTDGTDTYPNAAGAWRAAAGHQAGQVVAALGHLHRPEESGS